LRKLKLFGDSHVQIASVGSKLIAEKLAVLPFQVEFYANHGANWCEFETTETNGKLHFRADRVKDFKPVDYTIDSLDDIYVFSSPLHSTPTFIRVAWRNFCPWECYAANPDLHAVSTSLVQAWIEQTMKCRFAMLQVLKARGYNIAVVEPPKPLARTPTMFAIRPDVLLAVDRIHRDFIARWLNENRISIISVPENTQSEGFTIEEYSSKDPDPHHGSAKFGAEMLTKVLEYASNV
jgi:hypothetical protein